MLGVVADMQLALVAVIRFLAFQYIFQMLNHKIRYHDPLHCSGRYYFAVVHYFVPPVGKFASLFLACSDF